MTVPEKQDDPADPTTVVYTERAATYTWHNPELTVEDLPDMHGRLIAAGATGEEQIHIANNELRVEVARSTGELPPRHRDLWMPLDRHREIVHRWWIIAILGGLACFMVGILA